jgi:hypothetical protein
LDTLEEELLYILSSLSPPTSKTKVKGVSPVGEKEEAAPPADDGWLEVGKRNRTVVTRTVSDFIFGFVLGFVLIGGVTGMCRSKLLNLL